MLTIEPRGGLCNRLRAIDSAVALGAELGLPVRVLWGINSRMGASFGDLFHVPQEFHELQEFRADFLRSRWFTLARTLDLRRPRSHCANSDIKELLRADFDFRRFGDRRRLYFKTLSRFFHPYGVKHLFQPVPDLQRIIDERCAGFENCVGVHIRRTDHRPSIRYSPTSLFIEMMKKELQETTCRMFFVATDDESEDALLKRTFGNRIITYPKTSLARDNPQAIKDAVTDLFCLSRTDRIIGSAYSSFSNMAAEIEGIPMEVAAGELPPPSEFGW